MQMIEMDFICPENSGEMTTTHKGRFCDSCKKDIVDYSNMSATEISEQLKNTTGKICGIFKKQQIINANQVVIGSRFRLAFMMVFILDLTSTSMLAQDSLALDPPSLNTAIQIDTNFIINGQCVDSDTIGISFSRVWVELDSINGTFNRIYAKADVDGKFSLVLPNDIEYPISLFANCLGYNTSVVQEITFTPFKHEVEVVISMSEVLEKCFIGIIAPLPRTKDPYEIGKTRLDSEDIHQWD